MSQATIPFHVKNTFITVDQEDDLDDIDILKFPGQRQLTEPAHLWREKFGRDRTRFGEIEPEQEQEPYSRTANDAERAGAGGYMQNHASELEPEDAFDTNHWRRIVTGVEQGFEPQLSKPVHEQTNVTQVDRTLNTTSLYNTRNLRLVRMAAQATELEPDDSFEMDNCSFDADDWRRLVTGAELVPEPQMMRHEKVALNLADQILQVPSGSDGKAAPHWHSNMDSNLEPPPEWDAVSTVMIRNISKDYTQKSLLDEIHTAGFSGCYDFFYLPLDSASEANRGYAFINFKQASISWKFKMQFEKCHTRHLDASSSVLVVPATIQGYEANYQHYNKSRACKNSLERRPLFLRNVDHAAIARRDRSRKKGSLIDLAAAQMLCSEPKRQPEQKRFCPYCGNRSSSDFQFCPSCGSRL